MKYFFYIATLILISCEGGENSITYNDSNSNTDTLPKLTKTFSAKDTIQLVAFFDSIVSLDFIEVKKDIKKESDDRFKGIKKLNKKLSNEQMTKLIDKYNEHFTIDIYCQIDTNFAFSIFPFPIDSSAIVGEMVFFEVFHFSESEKFNEFAIVIGSGTEWERDVYFFKQNHIIGYQRNHNKYGIDMNFFVNESNKTVVYYEENFGTGTGFWQDHYFFYTYEGKELIPALNLLHNSNLSGWGAPRELWCKATIQSTKPLIVKYNHNFYIQTEDRQRLDIVSDSATITYKWNNKTNNYSANFIPKFSEEMLLSYYVTHQNLSNKLDLHVHKNIYEDILSNSDAEQKNIFFGYLNSLREVD